MTSSNLLYLFCKKGESRDNKDEQDYFILGLDF